MATKTFKIGLSNTDKQNMAQDVYERLLDLTFPEYNTATSYDVGDFVVYDNQLYKCIGATSGAWDSTKWQLATLNDLLTDIEDAVAFVNDKANVDGNYPTMTVGVADNLSPYDSESGADQDEPFSFQATGTDNGTDPTFSTGAIGLMKEKQGNSVVANQYSWTNTGNFPITVGGNLTISVVSGDTGNNARLLLNGTTTSNIDATLIKGVNMKVGHKYILLGCPSGGGASKYGIFVYTGGTAYDYGNGVIFTCDNNSATYSNIRLMVKSGQSFSNVILDPRCVDLTQMFGSNDNIPSDLLSHPEHFYRYYQGSLAYNEGTLVNANSQYIKCIGRQQWDEETKQGYYDGADGTYHSGSGELCCNSLIKVIPGLTYYIHGPSAIVANTVCEYDANGNFIQRQTYSINDTFTISNQTCFITFNLGSTYGGTYNHDITISLYYEDESGYDQYYPYEVLTNNDTGTEVLRSAGSAKDSKVPSGEIIRRIGVVDLGSLNYTRFESSGSIMYQTYNSSIKPAADNNTKANAMCSKFIIVKQNSLGVNPDTFAINSTGYITFYPSASYSTGDEFKQALNGVYLYYELAEPYTEQGTPFSENLIIDDFGTMSFEGTSGVPQGNLIFYPVDYKAFIDTTYNYTSGDPDNLALKSDLPIAPETYLKSLSGYDATKTQTLKNVNGTLTWVDD